MYAGRLSSVQKMGAITSSRPATKRWASSSSWKSAGSMGPMGWTLGRPSTSRRPGCQPSPTVAEVSGNRSVILGPHLVPVGEDQRVLAQFDEVDPGLPRAGDRIGGGEPGLLH